MTTRFRRVVLLSLLCLVSFATSASAECAWVLWGHAMTEARLQRLLPDNQVEFSPWTAGGAGWGPLTAHETRSQSEQALRAEVKRTGEITASETRRTAWTYRCYPDTIDPRGPKGK